MGPSNTTIGSTFMTLVARDLRHRYFKAALFGSANQPITDADDAWSCDIFAVTLSKKSRIEYIKSVVGAGEPKSTYTTNVYLPPNYSNHTVMPTLSVPQIHCGSCKSFIQSLLSPLAGIRDLRVDIDRHILSFSTSSADVDKEKLVDNVGQLLAQAGYTVSDEKDGEPSNIGTPLPTRDANAKHMEHCAACRDDTLLDSVVVAHDVTPLTLKTEFSIEGMTCASCTTSITNALKEHPGVISVDVKLMLNSATVVHDGNACSAADIVSEIESIGFEASVNNSTPVNSKGTSPKETVFGIMGMTCSSCSGPLGKAIQEIQGIESVVVSLVSNSMTVRYSPDRVTVEDIISAVEDLGFEVSQTVTRDLEEVASGPSERAVQLEFQGMFCKECPSRIAAHLSEIGVEMITRPTLASPVGSIRYTPSSKLTIRSILANLPEPITAKVYHPPSLHSIAMKLQAREARKIARLFLIATLFAIPTFVVGIVGMIALPKSHPFRQHIERPVWGGAGLGVIVLWALATPVQFGVGWIFYRKSYASLFGGRRRQWRWTNLIHFGSMDLLVALSTTTAYMASIAVMAIDVRTSPHDAMEVEMRTYFDSSVFLIFFILAGRLLEGRAKVKTGDAISMLGAIRPEKALLVTDVDTVTASEEAGARQVSVDVLELGDTILVQPGSIPPADGTILSGKTTVDESSLTGESRPVEKGPGDVLVCGTTNLTSAVTVRVDKLGDATVLEKIVRAVADAQGRKAPIERLADRISGVFVPIVVWLSLVVLAIWLGVSLGNALPEGSLPMGRDGTGDKVFFAFEFMIAMLVVACPCGIGLAAPTAQAVGAGMAAKAGILAQGGGEAFQRASQVTTVVFDKTGTLTLGEPRVTDSKILCESEWLLAAVREMEMGSTHPIALALIRHCESESKDSEPLQLLECEEKSGRGLVALVRVGTESYPVLVGNAALMNDHEVHVDESHAYEWQSQGKTVVYAAVRRSTPNSSDDQLWGRYELAMCFAVADALRPESISTVAELHKAGKQVWMLSGDNIVTAKAVAHDLGIPEARVVAGVLPHEKAEFITHLQSQHVVRSSRLPWLRREGQAVVAFCGDGLNDSAAIAAADVGIGLSHGSQITLSSSSFVLLSSSLSTLPFLLRLSRKVYLRQKLNFAWALVYNVAMIPVAAGAFYALGHTRLPPVWSALAMALSSVSVVVSSLAMRWGL